MKNRRSWTLRQAAVAGTAGGAMEVLWIGAAAAVLGVEGSQVARAVAATVIPASSGLALAPWLGLAVHFLLSVALAAVFMRMVGNRLRGAVLIVAAMSALALVWAVNFFVLLPALNPALPELLPHPVTLTSKLLFGLAMALALGRMSSPREEQSPRFLRR
jgi:hypothetical protein